VVSGGAGFIGSYLCERLLERGHQVLAVDNLVTGSRANVAHLLGNPAFTFLQHDVSQPIEIDAPVDHVLHFASPASPIDFPSMPIQIVKVGTLGTYHMLGLALAKKARFLLASTSEVYGDPLVHPQPESYWGNVNPIGPRGCYDEAKRCAEAFTMAYNRAHGVDTRIMRIFNTFGPRMRTDDGRVIPNYFRQALTGEPITVYGDGSQTRSLCYVDDLVAGALAVLDGADAMPINIGAQDEVTMLELAQIIKRIAGSASEIVFRALPEDDPKQRRPDTTRAREILGWEVTVSMEEGLARTLEYFKAALSLKR
jgi:dTDP-glucose 4,6-dehydratase